MNAEAKRPEEGFLGRWSRRKLDARDTAAAELDASPKVPPAPDAPPDLPPVDELTIESDFRGFFHPKVGEDVRRAALRKLFSDPHFNVMDGLDVYIDDYSKTEPIPPAMLAGLRQAQRILGWAAGKDDADDSEGQACEEPLADNGDAPALARELSDARTPIPDEACRAARELAEPAAPETE